MEVYKATSYTDEIVSMVEEVLALSLIQEK